MSKAEAVAAVLLVGATFYAVFGGADFGAGFWELFASRAKDPEAVRRRIEHSIAPVWEANHVWLIFILVFLWTGFPEAFSAVMSTLYLPLALAAVGIVLRGAGFAFGKVIEGRPRRNANTVFALSSIITPFFMGSVVGAIVSGEVLPDGSGDPQSWIGFLPFTLGALFVAAGAYISAVFLVRDALAAGEKETAKQFSRWALGAAIVAGALAGLGAYALHEEAYPVWTGLKEDGLPFAIASVGLGGLGVFLIAYVARQGTAGTRGLRGLRPIAVAALVALIWGGGAALSPYLLPPPNEGALCVPATEVNHDECLGLTIAQAAAPDETLTMLLVVFGLAVLLVVPAIVLLYTLSQKRLLE